MRLPIQIALGWPERLPEGIPSVTWRNLGSLEFEPPNLDKFPCIEIAYEAGRRGSTAAAVLNAANEEAVAAFLEGRLDFLGIARVVEAVVEAHTPAASLTLDAVIEAERWARATANAKMATLRAG